MITMSDYVTKTELDEALRKQTDEIAGILHTFMQDSSERFDAVDGRLDKLEMRVDTLESRFETRFDAVESQIRALNEKYDHLVTTIDGFIAKIDHYETEMVARDRQMERLLAWARKVSEKTGIPLEDL